MSDSLQHEPIRLLCPWNSPGKNTGACRPFSSPGDLPNLGIELRFSTFQVDSLPLSHQGAQNVSQSVMSNSLKPLGLWPTRLLYPWNSPGKNNRMGSPSLLQESSRPWNQTQVSHIAGRLFTIEAPRKPWLIIRPRNCTVQLESYSRELGMENVESEGESELEWVKECTGLRFCFYWGWR